MSVFTIYTYQFSPLHKHTQPDLFSGLKYPSPKEAMMNKNITFAGVLPDASYSYRGNNLSSHIEINQDDLIVLRLANKRTVRLEKNFQTEEFTNEPSIYVIIYNDFGVQRIAIEQNSYIFSDTNVVANILERSLSELLERHNLVISIKKEYQESEFWDMVKGYEGLIQMVRFEFDYPNLPRISSTLGKTLEELSKQTGSRQTRLELRNDQQPLDLSEDNRRVKDLTLASSNSGNNITFKAKGFRKHFKTGKTSKTVEFDALSIQCDNVEALKKILESIG